MWSYSTLFSAFGDVSFLDRVERIAYNALPATFASRRGGDMWNHQYLQANNEISAEKQYFHIWQIDDNQDSEVYGLAPNIGCCTANFNQGWPKLAAFSLFFLTKEGVPAVGVFAPAAADLADGTHIEMDTSYVEEKRRRRGEKNPHCVLCAVCCVLYAVCCVLCVVCSVLCAVCCVRLYHCMLSTNPYTNTVCVTLLLPQVPVLRYCEGHSHPPQGVEDGDGDGDGDGGGDGG